MTHIAATFEAACAPNSLDVNWQRLIGTHVLEREHPGVLTGSPLTDVRVTAGQAVSAGETLGAVAETIDAEAALGTHLHVETARAGTPVDVLSLLGESEVE